MSGAKVFDMLADVWLSLVAAYDPAADQLRVEDAGRVVAAIYACKYPNHLKSCSGTRYPETLAALSASHLSPVVKGRLASVERIDVTARNVNWVLQVRSPRPRLPPGLRTDARLQYWSCEACGDPISEQFGYRLERPGAAQYADL